MLQRVKEVQESDLRMVGALARNIQRVIAVTQADIDAAAAQGKAWVVKPVVKVSDPLDNLRGGTQLVIKQNSILPGQNVMRVMYIGGQAVVVGPGTSPLSLPDATDNDILSLIAFGGTEQRNLPDNYIERQFIYMMDGSYLLTDFVPTYDCKIEMDFQTTSIQSGAKSYLGGRSDSYPAGLRLGTGSGNNRLVVTAFSNSAYTATTDVENNTRYKFTFNNKVATLESGGTTLFTNTFTGENANGAALCINGLNSAGTITANLEGIYLYSFKAWNAQGELVADYVPAVQKGTVPVVGFYDTVSKTFKTATAGTFAAGGEAVPTPDTPMDIISNNGVLKARHQSGLPWGYTLLDYIESSGTQYIDTGINLTSDYNIEIKFNGKGQEAFIFGGRTSSTLKSYGLYLNNVANVQPNFSFAQTPQAVANYSWLDTILKYQDKSLYWNGSSVVTYTEIFSCDYPSYLFAMNNAGTAHEKKFTGKIYYTKIWNSGTLVRDFIPAKDSNNVVGLYDTVSGTFFTNAGTGTFTAGSAVSDPVEIYTDGTVETINVHTKNLFDEQWNRNTGVSTQTATWGQVVTASGWSTSGLIPVKAGQQYTVSYNTTVQIYVFYYESDGTMQQSYDTTAATKKTFTVPAGATHIRLQVNKSTEAQIADLESQLETGSTATDYVPYYNGGTATAEMLLKVGNYQDVQSIIDGAVTRNVGVKVLDGSENITLNQRYDGYGFYFPISGKNATIAQNRELCTHFDKTFSYSSYNEGLYDTTGFINASTTVNDIKQWLADQYNAGTPVIVVYPLATPTTESVTGQPMATTEGNNIAEITQASLNNLELQVEYIGE